MLSTLYELHHFPETEFQFDIKLHENSNIFRGDLQKYCTGREKYILVVVHEEALPVALPDHQPSVSHRYFVKL